ncbi:fatty acid synthase-like [Vespula squamosa]|uniref:Fatty acid synthase-like n=1 Tax=Vespula squamosa TaxID=30214 RepID=A0ABD2A838_VESSQ
MQQQYCVYIAHDNKILINVGSGSQAAINLALHEVSEVFTTFGHQKTTVFGQHQVEIALRFMTVRNHTRKHILGKLKDRIIELIRKLEAKRFIDRLILIDGAPQHLKNLYNLYNNNCIHHHRNTS